MATIMARLFNGYKSNWIYRFGYYRRTSRRRVNAIDWLPHGISLSKVRFCETFRVTTFLVVPISTVDCAL